MTSYIVRYYQPSTGVWNQIQLTGEQFSIGRAPDNGLVLDDLKVSRQHATLYVDARGVWIVDQHSGNGTLVGGQRLSPGARHRLPLNQDFAIGDATLRVEAHPPPIQHIHRPAAAPASQPKRRGFKLALPLAAALGLAACVCVAGLAGAVFVLPGLLSSQPTSVTRPNNQTPSPPQTAAPAFDPPQVIDSLPASGGQVQDDRGVSLTVPPEALESGQQAFLERANLSPGMQAAIEAFYQVESLAYAVRLQEGQDGVGRPELALPAASPDSRLAVLVDGRYLGVLETPARNGMFRLNPSASLADGVQTYPAEGGGAAAGPNRYLVLTPKAGASQAPRGGQLASRLRDEDPDGSPCISEFWTVNHCWRNPESSVYVFWEDDVPANLKDQEYLRIIDTIKAVAALMKSFEDKGFTGAAISASNPAYLIVEAGAAEPYYSFKTGNVYLPWDIIGGIGDAHNRCTLAHEFFHWIEDEEYRMGAAAISGPKSWWLEASAENAAFMLDSACVERNLTQYGLVTTGDNILGFQAAPLLWEWGEQARYIHALQLYLSLCDGGTHCALSESAWINAINQGTYPLEGAALAAYEANAKDLGRFLLGAAPAESRGGAVIPPSAVSGSRFGDYLSLRTSTRGRWDFGLTMNQFSQAGDERVNVQATIKKGGVYPLWVSNGTRTPMGGAGGNTGLPGLLEIEAGPAFWVKRDQAEPEFYPAGTNLKLGPISDKLGVGAARIVAVAPGAEQVFKANLSLADLSGDWMVANQGARFTAVDCQSYSSDDDTGTGPDTLLQLFSGYGTYVQTSVNPNNIVLAWQGTLPDLDGATGTSEITVEADKIRLRYQLTIPKPSDGLARQWLGRPRPAEPAPLAGWPALWPVLPVLSLAAWAGRGRPNPGATAMWLLLLALALTGCISIWGTIEMTYTFDKLEYVDPQPAAAAGEEQGAVLWRLGGQAEGNLDLTIAIESTDADGNTVREEEPCKLTFSGNATGTIGPDGSVLPPE